MGWLAGANGGFTGITVATMIYGLRSVLSFSRSVPSGSLVSLAPGRCNGVCVTHCVLCGFVCSAPLQLRTAHMQK